MKKHTKKTTICDVLGIPAARKLIDMIEELRYEEDLELVRIRTALIQELRNDYGYTYIL